MTSCFKATRPFVLYENNNASIFLLFMVLFQTKNCRHTIIVHIRVITIFTMYSLFYNQNSHREIGEKLIQSSEPPQVL